MTAAIGFAVPPVRLGRLAFIHVFGVIVLGLLGSRTAWVALGPKRRMNHRVLVLGVGRSVAALPELQFSGTRPFTILGFLDDAPDAADRVPAGFELLGKTKDLLSLADELRPDLDPRGARRDAARAARRGPPGVPAARHQRRGMAHVLREADRQDPGDQPAAELADLLRRFREDRDDAHGQAGHGHRPGPDRTRPVPACDGARRPRGQARLQGADAVPPEARRRAGPHLRPQQVPVDVGRRRA